MSDGTDVPLARLFAMAYRVLVDDLHDRLRARGWIDVRPAFGFALLAARDGPTTTTELGALMGTTKQSRRSTRSSSANGARSSVPTRSGVCVATWRES